MNNILMGQKEVPNLTIDGMELDTASDFHVYMHNAEIDVVVTLAVIPQLIKTRFLNNQLINTLLYVREPVRFIDGSDGMYCWKMEIKSCTMDYSLNAEGDPCCYYLIFRNYNNG